MNDILLYINDSIEIKKYVRKVVPYDYKDDMLSHIMLEVTKVNQDKLRNMYRNKVLKFLIFKMIRNQMDPNCNNCFYRIYIQPSQFHIINNMNDIDVIAIDEEDDRLDDIDSHLRSMKPWKVDLFNQYYREGKKLREIAEERNMNIKTVMSWVYEVRDKLKKEI